MKIIIPGGNGQVGTILAKAFHEEGHEVIVLARRAVAAAWKVLPWDGHTIGPWASAMEGADLVINLAGRSVNCRYTKENMRQMMDSRVQSTRVIGEVIAQCAQPPRVWLQMSTATIYSHRYDTANDDVTGQIGGAEPDAPAYWGYSIQIAQEWERAAAEANTPATRKVMLRSAMVMSPDRGGIFDVMLGLVRRGLGGTAGDGRQYLSWIHDADFVAAVKWLIEHEELNGPVNLAAPEPLPNREFMRTLREAWGTRLGLPAAKWMLTIGAFFMRTDPELVLKSRRVIPTPLVQSGFNFRFPSWREAARDLCERWKGSVAVGKQAIAAG
jgi:uncharacterized protein (TIGR01777 family)